MANPQKTDARAWMLTGDEDFSSVLGDNVKKSENNKAAIRSATNKIKAETRMARELNPQMQNAIRENLNAGGDGTVESLEATVSNLPTERKMTFGDSGSKWRQMKLKRVLETAEKQKRNVHDVALDRFSSKEEFDFVMSEYNYLNGKKSGDTHINKNKSDKGFVKNDKEFKELKSDKPLSQTFTYLSKPVLPSTNSLVGSSINRPSLQSQLSTTSNPLKEELQSLQTQITKARISGKSQSEISTIQNKINEITSKLSKNESDKNSRKQNIHITSGIGSKNTTMNDLTAEIMISAVGLKTNGVTRTFDDSVKPGNKKRKIEYSQDTTSLMQMLMREKLAKGEDYDASLAHGIATDSSFVNDGDYMDSRSDFLSKEKVRSASSLRNSAIAEYQQIENALSKCKYCPRESNQKMSDNKLSSFPSTEANIKNKPGLGHKKVKTKTNNLTWPKVPVLARGTRTYLALPDTIDMLPYHCYIVPIEHELSVTSMDEDTFTEIRNFQKALYGMYNELGLGCIFVEQVINLKEHRHTVIEVLAVPLKIHDDLPGYFKESFLTQGSNELEASNKKMIPTSHSKGGLRSCLIKGRPYFHVWFNPNEGMGHYIESRWSPYFAREIVGGVLDMTPDQWRKLSRSTYEQNQIRRKKFLQSFSKYDWTKMISK